MDHIIYNTAKREKKLVKCALIYNQFFLLFLQITKNNINVYLQPAVKVYLHRIKVKCYK